MQRFASTHADEADRRWWRKASDRSISQAQVDTALEGAKIERQKILGNLKLQPTFAPVVPADGSLRVDGVHMTYTEENFGPGYTNTGTGVDYGDALSLGGIKAMSSLGRRDGFDVIVTAGDPAKLYAKLTAAERTNVFVLKSTFPYMDVWNEDRMSARTDGSLAYPARSSLSAGDPKIISLLTKSILEHRIFRYYGEKVSVPLSTKKEQPDEEMITWTKASYPLAAYWAHCMVDFRGAQAQAVEMALLRGAPVLQELAYVEGGNHLAGRRGGKPYELVGWDSFVVTRLLMEYDAGHKFSDDEVCDVIAKSLGVELDRLFFIDQAFEYHIDASVAIFGSNIYVNDANKAFRLTAKWARADHEAARPKALRAGAPALAVQQYRKALAKWKRAGKELEGRLTRLGEESKIQKWVEDRTAADAERAAKVLGMKVYRVAGKFMEHSPDYPDQLGRSIQMGFFNKESWISGDRRLVWSTFGGNKREIEDKREKHDKRPERNFRVQIARTYRGSFRMDFLASHVTRGSYSVGGGGLGCRAKLEGRLSIASRHAARFER